MDAGFDDAAYSHVCGLVESVKLSDTVDESDDMQPPAAKHMRVDTVTSGLDFLLRGRSKLTAKSEFDRYLCCDADDDLPVLSWWQKHEAAFPGRAVVARKYLGIPATSVQSERLFSATGRLISKHRARLSPDHADCLAFLNKNFDLIN